MQTFRLSVLALTLSLLTLGNTFAADDLHAAAYQECAKACNECQLMCDMCADHCAKLVAEGKKEHLRTLKTCLDCAEHCAAAARIVAGHGPFSDLICTACAEACKRCGEECKKFEEDEMMKKCAEECFKCEKACRDMLKHINGKSKPSTNF